MRAHSLEMLVSRCVATDYAFILMAILTVMTSGSMPTALIFIQLDGVRAQDTSYTLQKVNYKSENCLNEKNRSNR